MAGVQFLLQSSLKEKGMMQRYSDMNSTGNGTSNGAGGSNISRANGGLNLTVSERDEMDEQERPVRVLVVDDEPLIVEMLTMGLSYEGFEVTVARTGFEALEEAQRTKPDLVVLDIMLPGINGVEVCKRLRSQGD